MGNISKKLHQKLKSKSGNLKTIVPHRRAGEPLPGGVKDIKMLIKDGLDPIHAVYVYIQQISSHFAEGASQLPEMKLYAKLAGDAEEEYMPSGPPMSPLTVSFFTCWAFYDLRFGKDGDTIGKCQIDANDLFLMNPDQLDALHKLSESRMGIYEHVGATDGLVRLRELITGDEYSCLCTSAYHHHQDQAIFLAGIPDLKTTLPHA